MFDTMAGDHLFASFILLLVSNTGFSAEIHLFVRTGASVKLDLQTQELPEFDDLSWTNYESKNIVRYTSELKRQRQHPSYNDRVDFNNKTFSLTLKNMQKADSGLYTARISGSEIKDIVKYKVSVTDAVEAPVMTVNSIWSSSDSCTVSFTCRAHELMINSSYQNNRCSPEEVTSHDINTLILDCSKKSIICNHSNPVSWKQDRINITHLCDDNEENEIQQPRFNIMFFIVIAVGVIVFGLVGGLALYCCCKNKTGVKQADDTDYDDVETLTQKMTGDTWTTITYYTVGRNQTLS
ncbi:CD48 antigen-like [Garra rufa]|uniref:CD48 antigen-like n=1 Tax=Garra rufa TaxID=137080 RepID=UPI003CCEBB48